MITKQTASRSAEGSVFSRSETRKINGREKTVQQWYARIRFTDLAGKRRERKRQADSRAHALQLRRQLRADLELELSELARPATDKTFAEIAEWYEAEYLQPPRFVGDVKVAGLSSYKTQRGTLRRLVATFGPQKVQRITYDDLRAYKAKSLQTPIVSIRNYQLREPKTSIRTRSVVPVHRELQLLRTIFNRAIQRGWMTGNPFAKGDPLINMSAETERMRVLSRTEESALLAQCVDERAHLRLAVICAIDTALRKNEQFTLRWANIDLDKRSIELRARNAKTLKKRTVPISDRLSKELAALKAGTQPEREDLLFPANNRSAWRTARRRAGLDDVHWHDLRHTSITWMLDSGIPEAKVMRISGHTNYRTFLKYVNMTDELIREAADKLDARRARHTTLKPVPSTG
jgi:integrase